MGGRYRPIFIVAIIFSASAEGVDVTCFSSGFCSGIASASGIADNACCEGLGVVSYQTATGHCCSCAEDLKVEFGSLQYTVSEGNGFVSLNIQRCGSFEKDVQVSLTFEDITAEGGIDYGPFPSRTIELLTIVSANSTGIDFGINIREDDIVETEETFSVVLRILEGEFNPFGGGGGGGGEGEASSDAIVTISDNDFVSIGIEPRSFVVMEAEEMPKTEFLITKNGTAVRNVSVILQSVSNTSTSNVDFIGLQRELVFPPDVNSFPIRFTVLDDNVVEDIEYVQLVLMGGVDEKGVRFPEGSVVDGTILDDNDTVMVTFSPTSYEVAEDSGVAIVRLRKEGVNERDITVVVRVDSNVSTATDGLDFNLTVAEVTFRPEDSFVDFEVVLYQEGNYEEPELISLFLEPESGETAVRVSGIGEIMIIDSDVVAAGFSLGRSMANESVKQTNISVEIFEGVLETPVEVRVIVVPKDSDLAIEGRDFNLSTVSVIFQPNGPRLQTVTINLIDDPFFEGREDLTLQLQTSNARVELSPDMSDISIVDNEDLVVLFQNASYSVTEGEPFIDVVVLLVASIERVVELDFATAEGRASEGSDYLGVSQILTFTPTSASNTIRIMLLDDGDSEGLEELFLQIFIVDEMLGRPGMIQQAEIVIFDDENIFIEFSSSVYSSGEGDRFVPLVIMKSGETQDDIDVIISLRDGSARGGIDYGPFPSPLLHLTTTLLSSETEIQFGVVIHEDNIVERLENFTVSLSLPDQQEFSGNVFIKDISEATVLLVDNDVINITISPKAVEVEESAALVQFDIFRIDDFVIDNDLVINVNAATISGSARASQDFMDNRMTFMFAEDLERNFTFSVVLLEDELVEGPEEFIVVLQVTNEDKDYVFVGREEVTVMVIDNDAVTINLQSPLYEVIESSGVAQICLTKDAETSSALLVLVQPAETTPTLADTFQARANIDFDPSPIMTSFQPKDESICVEIPIVNDVLSESREVFLVSFSVLETSLAVIIGQSSRAVVVINDLIDVDFGLVRTSIEHPESVGNIDVCLEVYNPSLNATLDLTMHVVLQTISATAGSSDFIPSTMTVTLDDMTRSACITIEIIDDDEFEDLNEVFFVVISDFSLSDARMIGFVSTNTTKITITDDDRDIVLGFVENSTSVSVGESVGAVTLCVNLFFPGADKEFTSDVRVVVGTRNGSAGTLDYKPISSLNQELTLQLNSVVRTACFMVEITNDDAFEGRNPENFEVELVTVQPIQNSDLQSIMADPSIAQITIVDDEREYFVGFEQNSVSVVVDEDVGRVQLCVNSIQDSNLTVAPFMIQVDVGNESTAEIESDFEFDSSLILLFTDAQRQQCFEVSITDDELSETSEPEIIVLLLHLEIGSPLRVAFRENSSVAEIFIRDNDELPTTEVSMATTLETVTTAGTIEVTTDITTMQTTTGGVTTERPTQATTEEVTTTERPIQGTTEEVTTERPTQATTEEVTTTERPTQGTTEEVTTERPTQGTTEEVTTERPTQATTEEDTTERSTQATTEEDTTEKPTQGTTEEVTIDVTTERPTQGTTEEVTTERPTQSTTEEVTIDVTTERPTQGTTEEVTIDVTTERPTQGTTEEVTTERPTQATTEEVTTERPTQATTEEDATEMPTQGTTEEVTIDVTTERPTQGTTEEVTTERPTQATTEEVTTEKPTQGTTEEVTTERPTQATTEEITTERPTQATTEQVTTERPTQATTKEDTTEKPTQGTTEEVTIDVTTERPTQGTTEEVTTERPTQATTEEITTTAVSTESTTPESTRPTVSPILANDTVLGDPLFIVPLKLPKERLEILPLDARGRIPNLCFEIHGAADTHFNLISDSCTSVNALYSAVSEEVQQQIGLNIISKIGISTIDSEEQCIFIEISTSNDCMPIIHSKGDGGMSEPTPVVRYTSNGISVIKRRSRVRISVPNCENIQLVMSVTCMNVGIPMIRFDVTRGVNLQPMSHGLLGQFWNVPIGIEPYTYSGLTPTYLDVDHLYALTVSHPSSNARTFVAEYFGQKWDYSQGTCFYAGNTQGGDLLEITDPSYDDTVIEGEYTDYIVKGIFENSFKYSRYSGPDLFLVV